MKQIISTDKAPAALGAYSQAVKVGGLLFTSGQLGLDANGKLASTVSEQTKQAMLNLKAILDAAGTDFTKAVKTTIFIADMADFSAVNEVYASFFSANYPARSCVAVKELPKKALVEIEMIVEA